METLNKVLEAKTSEGQKEAQCEKATDLQLDSSSNDFLITYLSDMKGKSDVGNHLNAT